MGKSRNCEVFIQDGRYCRYCMQNGEIIVAEETDLSGISVRMLDTVHKKMFSTTRAGINVEAIAKKLEEYDRNVCLINKTERDQRVKKARIDTEAVEWLRDFSLLTAPLYTSFVFWESQKEIFDFKNNKRRFCSHEKYAFWNVENDKDDVLNRMIFDTFLPERQMEYRQRILREKERLLLPLREVETDGCSDILFEGKAAGYLYHEIVGHCFEADKAVKSACFSGNYVKRLTDYPIDAWDDNFELGAPVICDDEGTKKTSAQIISKGCASGLLTDRNCKPEPLGLTGNCRRSSIYFYPETRMYRIKVQGEKENIEPVEKRVQHALVITHIHRGSYEHRTGMVSLYAYVDKVIMDGVLYPKRMYIIVKDKIENYFKGICAMSDKTESVGIYCVSNSGELYTESEAPSTLINGLHIERKWLL